MKTNVGDHGKFNNFLRDHIVLKPHHALKRILNSRKVLKNLFLYIFFYECGRSILGYLHRNWLFLFHLEIVLEDKITNIRYFYRASGCNEPNSIQARQSKTRRAQFSYCCAKESLAIYNQDKLFNQLTISQFNSY